MTFTNNAESYTKFAAVGRPFAGIVVPFAPKSKTRNGVPPMYNSFLSVVCLLERPEEIDLLATRIAPLSQVLNQHFSDYEIILVNNTASRNFEPRLSALSESVRQHLYLIHLSSTIDTNHAVLAGLDRANGDYTVVYEFLFADQPEMILDLFQKSQEGFDIVYLKARERKMTWGFRWLYKLFYLILKNYSQLQIDEKAHNMRIISRRALNSLLRMRENLRFMKAIYSMVGYQTASILVDVPLQRDRQLTVREQFRTFLVAITSFTTFLRSLLLWIFIFSFLFLMVVVFNALMVRFTNYDVFGNYHEAISGWTFLVVLISIFFAITCLNLYIMSIYLSNIYSEIKQRPLYIVESVKRL